MQTKVAIITRTRNRLLLLKRALASVRNQAFDDWKHVIVNDGGDPAELDALLAELPADHREKIECLHLPESVGMQNASNKGIKSCQSEFVCIHDDDDEWEPEYLTATVAFLEEAGSESPYQGVIAGTEEVYESLHKDGSVKELSRKRHRPLDEISLFRIGYENPFPPIAFCYRRSAWEAVGGYDPRWDLIGDLDFNLRFLLLFEIGVIDRVLAFYRIRENKESDTLSNSISEKKLLHKQLFNEFRNTRLRNAGNASHSSLALGLNVAPYLVESQWMLDDLFHRSQATEKALKTLTAAVSLEGYEDRFDTIRHALAILVDHARDDGTKQQLTGILKSLEEAAAGRRATSQRLEELIRAVGFPRESADQKTLHEALSVVLDQVKDDRVRIALDKMHAGLGTTLANLHQGLSSSIDAMHKDIGSSLSHINEKVGQASESVHENLLEAGKARQATAARLEALIRSVGLFPEEAETNLIDRLARVVDFIADPSRNGQAYHDAMQHRIDILEDRLRQLEERSVAFRIGKLKVGTVGPSPKEED